MDYTVIEKPLTIKEAVKKKNIIVDHDIPDIKKVISKNCYRYSKKKTARKYLVLIDGSDACRKAFDKLINNCDRNDLVTLLCIRPRQDDLVHRWFIKYTAVHILEKYNEVLQEVKQNNSIIYPETRLSLLACVAVWVGREGITDIVLGGASWSFRRRLAKKCQTVRILNL